MDRNEKIEADCRLLKFNKYEDYLDSMVTPLDRCLLPNRLITRQLAALGYRSSGETLSREDFERRRDAVILYLHPPYKSYVMASTGSPFTDLAQRELAIRERPNRIGILSTIIFMRHISSGGVETSSYLDYAQDLKRRDWDDFFKNQVLFLPSQNDLSYLNWKNDIVAINDSENYKVIPCSYRGLTFENKRDRKQISTDPTISPGHNTLRKRVKSKIYQHLVLFDHFVRKRIPS